MNLRIAPLAAAGLVALLGANLWLIAVIFTGASREETLAVAPPAWDAKLSAAGHDTALKPIGAYRQMLAQPVFFKSREPYVPPRPAPAAPAPVAIVKPSPPPVVDPGLMVAGIIISGGVRKAYVHGKSDPHGNWVAEGETLTGWKVQAIDAGGVKLQQQDHTIELQLYPVK